MHWMQFAVAGSSPGTRVAIELPDGRSLVRELYAGSSYLASEDPRLHFGLGEFDRPLTATVTWPDGSTETFGGLAVDKRHILTR